MVSIAHVLIGFRFVHLRPVKRPYSCEPQPSKVGGGETAGACPSPHDAKPLSGCHCEKGMYGVLSVRLCLVTACQSRNVSRGSSEALSPHLPWWLHLGVKELNWMKNSTRLEASGFPAVLLPIALSAKSS